MAMLELMQELLQRLSNDGAGADFSRTVLMLAAKCRCVRLIAPSRQGDSMSEVWRVYYTVSHPNKKHTDERYLYVSHNAGRYISRWVHYQRIRCDGLNFCA